MNGHEHHQATRWNLKVPLRVFDITTDELVGHVVNISLEGMLMVSEPPIDVRLARRFTLELPDTAHDTWMRLPVHVVNIHVPREMGVGVCNLGFQCADIAPDTLRTLHRLIDDEIKRVRLV